MSDTTPPLPGPSGRPPTLHDIARTAGVSVRTVSRVVNSRPGPAAATRERVLEVVHQLGYRPNLMARSLVTRQSNTLGLVVTYLTDPFFAELARGIQQACDRHGYLVYLTSSEGQAERQREVINSLLDRGCDGLILFPVRGADEQVVGAADRGVPVVTIDYPRIRHRLVGVIEADTEHGATLAVAHLLDQGRRRLAMISSPASETVDEPREHGFRTALAPHVADPRLHVIWADESVEGGAGAVADLLDRFPDLDGILAYNDLMAIGAIRALEAAGRVVPDDVAVIGVDDVSVSALVRPALTTIRIDREAIGARAVEMLLELRSDPERAPTRDVVPTSLVVRDSA